MADDDSPGFAARQVALAVLEDRLQRFAMVMRMATTLTYVDDASLAEGCGADIGVNALLQNAFRTALTEVGEFAALLELSLDRMQTAAALGLH
jgi:hypothetical protein